MYEELVVIAPLAPMSVGDRFDSGVGSVPLHLTVLPKVRVPAHRSESVVSAVRDIAAGTGPITFTATGRAGFGRDGGVNVTTVGESEDLRRMHARLRDEVCRAGVKPVTPAYVGAGYRPHVTDSHDGLAISPRDQLVLTALVILDCTQPVRRVAYKAPLSG